LVIERLYDTITHSAQQTVALGMELASLLQPPCVVLLCGELGSGKTTLAKGIAAGLGAANEDEVTSPSFTLVHEYTRHGAPGTAAKVYHIDLYRIDTPRELGSLGLDEVMRSESTVLIEWGDKLPSGPSAAHFRIELELAGEDQRRIIVMKNPK
jgi:tRNA threonylcarbamoyladenosine biosynthesis protein TsaE